MCNIDDIMSMLDWTNSEEEQQKGIELARNVKSINVFLQPLHPGNSKNVWDNCAKILAEKSDEQLNPYVMSLLHWIEDLNWPGALVIYERLKKFANVDMLRFCVENYVKSAFAANDSVKVLNLTGLIENDKLRSVLQKNIVDILVALPLIYKR
jgi:hypothetical protein